MRILYSFLFVVVFFLWCAVMVLARPLSATLHWLSLRMKR
jgi:hypothetical protein